MSQFNARVEIVFDAVGTKGYPEDFTVTIASLDEETAKMVRDRLRAGQFRAEAFVATERPLT